MWVIYEVDTTVLYRNRRTRRDAWATIGAAKAEMTRQRLDIFKYGLSEKGHFHKRIERTEVVYSIHDLKKERPITQGVNTPRCCDPSSELYWSM
jgi:hypothetical protein